MGKEMQITLTKFDEWYALNLYGGVVLFDKVVICSNVVIRLYFNDVKLIGIYGDSMDESLQLMHDMGIKVIDERVK
jgi:hypothetical protein